MKKTRSESTHTRPLARVEQRSAIRYPSLAGAVGLALVSGGCQEPVPAPPAATLAPVGQAPPDTGGHDAPTGLTLPGPGGWGSLAAGGGAGPSAPVEDASTEEDAGVDAGLDAGKRHVPPTHDVRPLPGRMPLIRPIQPPGEAPSVQPEFQKP
jgi:hypothetical protein